MGYIQLSQVLVSPVVVNIVELPSIVLDNSGFAPGPLLVYKSIVAYVK